MLISLKIGTAFAKVMPRKIGISLAKYAAYIFSLFPTGLKSNVEEIHKIISPSLNKAELNKRVRNVFAYYAAYWFDVFWLSSPRRKDDIDKIVVLEGSAHLAQANKKAKEQNSGVILALTHLGSFELAGAWLAGTGENPLVVAERLEPPELFELFTNTRKVAGMEVVAHDDNPTSKLISALKENRYVCLVADRDITGSGLSHVFFNKEKNMPQGPASLAYLTKAVILPVATYLNHDATVSIVFYPELEMQKGNDKKEVIYNTSQKLFSIFEEMIKRDPEQYHVLQNEWKS